MFTGIIEHVGTVQGRAGGAAGTELQVELGPCAEGVRPGDSIAVDGVCLTVTRLAGAVASFDAEPESLARTTLGSLRGGDPVHLERALQAGGRLDGHLVQGHVDGVGEIRARVPRGDAIDLTIELADQPLELVVEKGSIAVAGVSLTVNRLQGQTFELSVVPFTQRRTRLAALRVGQRVNLEFDIIGRYVARLLGQRPGGRAIDAAFLKEHGFA